MDVRIGNSNLTYLLTHLVTLEVLLCVYLHSQRLMMVKIGKPIEQVWHALCDVDKTLLVVDWQERVGIYHWAQVTIVREDIRHLETDHYQLWDVQLVRSLSDRSKSINHLDINAKLLFLWHLLGLNKLFECLIAMRSQLFEWQLPLKEHGATLLIGLN